MVKRMAEVVPTVLSLSALWPIIVFRPKYRFQLTTNPLGKKALAVLTGVVQIAGAYYVTGSVLLTFCMVLGIMCVSALLLGIWMRFVYRLPSSTRQYDESK